MGLDFSRISCIIETAGFARGALPRGSDFMTRGRSMSISAKDIRNVAIVGHSGEGKTTLFEAMLFNSGAIERMGKVENGTTVSDFDEQEIARKMSVSLSMASITWKDVKINLLDVPGFYDFEGEFAEAMRACGAAIVVTGANGTVTVGAEKAIDLCMRAKKPLIIFINGMDKENADYPATIAAFREKYKNRLAPIQIPIMDGKKMTGNANALTGKAYHFTNTGPEEISVPEEYRRDYEEMQLALTEAAAESDDVLLEKYFEQGYLSREDMIHGIRKGIFNMNVIPVMAGSAVQNALGGISLDADTGSYLMDTNAILCLICALVALAVVIVCSVYGKKMLKMIPFIIGILAGYAVAAVFTGFSYLPGAESMRIIDFSVFKNMEWVPDFTFVEAFFSGEWTAEKGIGSYIGTIAVAYIPVAFVVFAEHLADHKNISSIIGSDLLREPGLSRTLLGDGVGSMVGAVFGGCPNTTYGESIACVAISGNASVVSILLTSILAVVFSFVAPFVTFLSSIPSCVMGGVCIALYGFIAVSGLKMVQKVDLNDNGNLFTVSAVLVTGVGGMAMTFGKITITAIAVALILGVLTNGLVKLGKKKAGSPEAPAAEAADAAGAASAEEGAAEEDGDAGV